MFKILCIFYENRFLISWIIAFEKVPLCSPFYERMHVSVVSVLTNSPKISDMTKRNGFQLHFSQINQIKGQKDCRANYNSFCDPLTC